MENTNIVDGLSVFEKVSVNDGIKKLKEACEAYSKELKKSEYRINFSDGEEIRFRFFDINLSHLLGVDYKSFYHESIKSISEKILDIDVSKVNSYELLSRIILYIDDIAKHDFQYPNTQLLNYNQIKYKSIAFLHIYKKFLEFNFGCIDFDVNVYNTINNQSFKTNSTKLLFVPIDNNMELFYVIGLKYDERINMYRPETLFYTEKISEYMNGQKLVLPTQFAINDDDGGFFKLIETSEIKNQILDMYNHIMIRDRINAYIDIAFDYQKMLNRRKKY